MGRRVDYIFWHTAAHGASGRVFDTSAAEIDRWHRERGWKGIGYNAVIRLNGQIEPGRDINEIPAAVYGFNQHSYHICFSGHGDLAPLTGPQLESGIAHTIQILRECSLVDAFLQDPDSLIVLGHREVSELVKRGIAPYPTTKSCPGKLVDMDQVRQLIRARLLQNGEKPYKFDRDAAEELYAALIQLYGAAKKMQFSDDLIHELNAFRKQPEIEEIISRLRRESSHALSE